MAVNSYNPFLMFAPASSAYPLDGDVGAQPRAKKWPVEGVDQDQQTMSDIAEGVQILSLALGIPGGGEAAGAPVAAGGTAEALPNMTNILGQRPDLGGPKAETPGEALGLILGTGRPDLSGKRTEGMLPTELGSKDVSIRGRLGQGIIDAGKFLYEGVTGPRHPDQLEAMAGRKAVMDMRELLTPAIDYSQLPFDNSDMTTPPESQAPTPTGNILEKISPGGKISTNISPRTQTPAKAAEPTQQAESAEGGRNIGQTAGSLVKLLGSSFLGDYAQNPAIAQVAQQIAYDALGELGWLSPQAEAEMAESGARKASYEATTKKIEQMTPFEMLESFTKSKAAQLMNTPRGTMDIGTRKIVEVTKPKTNLEPVPGGSGWLFDPTTSKFYPPPKEYSDAISNIERMRAEDEHFDPKAFSFLMQIVDEDQKTKIGGRATGRYPSLNDALLYLDEKQLKAFNQWTGGASNINIEPEAVSNFGGKK